VKEQLDSNGCDLSSSAIKKNGIINPRFVHPKEGKGKTDSIRNFISKIGVDAIRNELHDLSSLSQLEKNYLSEEIHFAIVAPEYYQLLHTLNQLRMENGKNAFLIMIDDLLSSNITENGIFAQFIHQVPASS
jgi:hypothetical protein